MRTIFKLWIIFAFNISYGSVPFNCPYKDYSSKETNSYQFLSAYPENLDPILNYDFERNFLISQIYEPLYTIEYKSKPYRIVPNIAKKMPKIEYFDAKNQQIKLEDNIPIAYTIYTIPLRSQIFYQPHPGFCRVLGIKNCDTFKREVKAEDYAYQIKRIAQIDSHSPFASILSKFILGFKTYQKTQRVVNTNWKNLTSDKIFGISVLDDYTLQIITKGYSNQWLYWLTMNFLSPLPWEIDKYQHVFSKDKRMLAYSIGSGPYMLFDNLSNQKIELQKNPNYRDEYFQFSDGLRKIPVVDKFFFIVEKENIPRWNKFLQGYFDLSTIPSESFQNTIQVNKYGKIHISPEFKEKNIHLDIQQSSYVSGIVFNFLDPVVGGYSVKSRKFRQAISLAFDFDEYRTIFRSGRGEIAHDPIPPAILPDKDQKIGFNDVLYKNHVKKSLAVAKRLLAEAGFPKGINPKTHKPLILTIDQVSQGLPEEKALFSWFRKQVGKLGIQLYVRENDINRFNKRLLNANFQMTFFIWSADFPNLENFLMLFYGPNHNVKTGGPNRANFNHKEYNRLYRELEIIPDGERRDFILRKMIQILQIQAVWVWANYGEAFYMLHDWTKAPFLQDFSSGILKFYRIDTEKRMKAWNQWNKVSIYPIVFSIVILFCIFLPFWLERRKMRKAEARRSPF